MKVDPNKTLNQNIPGDTFSINPLAGSKAKAKIKSISATKGKVQKAMDLFLSCDFNVAITRVFIA